MKKRTAILLILAMIICLAAVLTACDKTENNVCEHTFGEWTTVSAATCTTPGSRKRTCTVCETEETEAIPADHNYGEWETTSPSCTVAGSKTRTCTVCNNIDTEVIPALDHNFSEWITVDPSCDTAGYRARVCVSCLHEETETIPALEHSYGGWTTVTDATCSQEGSRERICSECETEETEAIPALDHIYGEWETTSPSCTVAGSMKRTCTKCQHEDALELPALEHTFGEWTTVTYATCSQEGSKKKSCLICHHEEFASIPKTTDHNRDENGICAVCGDGSLDNVANHNKLKDSMTVVLERADSHLLKTDDYDNAIAEIIDWCVNSNFDQTTFNNFVEWLPKSYLIDCFSKIYMYTVQNINFVSLKNDLKNLTEIISAEQLGGIMYCILETIFEGKSPIIFTSHYITSNIIFVNYHKNIQEYITTAREKGLEEVATAIETRIANWVELSELTKEDCVKSIKGLYQYISVITDLTDAQVERIVSIADDIMTKGISAAILSLEDFTEFTAALNDVGTVLVSLGRTDVASFDQIAAIVVSILKIAVMGTGEITFNKLVSYMPILNDKLVLVGQLLQEFTADEMADIVMSLNDVLIAQDATQGNKPLTVLTVTAAKVINRVLSKYTDEQLENEISGLQLIGSFYYMITGMEIRYINGITVTNVRGLIETCSAIEFNVEPTEAQINEALNALQTFMDSADVPVVKRGDISTSVVYGTSLEGYKSSVEKGIIATQPEFENAVITIIEVLNFDGTKSGMADIVASITVDGNTTKYIFSDMYTVTEKPDEDVYYYSLQSYENHTVYSAEKGMTFKEFINYYLQNLYAMDYLMFQNKYGNTFTVNIYDAISSGFYNGEAINGIVTGKGFDSSNYGYSDFFIEIKLSFTDHGVEYTENGEITIVIPMTIYVFNPDDPFVTSASIELVDTDENSYMIRNDKTVYVLQDTLYKVGGRFSFDHNTESTTAWAENPLDTSTTGLKEFTANYIINDKPYSLTFMVHVMTVEEFYTVKNIHINTTVQERSDEDYSNSISFHVEFAGIDVWFNSVPEFNSFMSNLGFSLIMESAVAGSGNNKLKATLKVGDVTATETVYISRFEFAAFERVDFWLFEGGLKVSIMFREYYSGGPNGQDGAIMEREFLSIEEANAYLEGLGYVDRFTLYINGRENAVPSIGENQAELRYGGQSSYYTFYVGVEITKLNIDSQNWSASGIETRLEYSEQPFYVLNISALKALNYIINTVCNASTYVEFRQYIDNLNSELSDYYNLTEKKEFFTVTIEEDVSGFSKVSLYCLGTHVFSTEMILP